MRQGVRIDGEYYLKVKSRILQVCMFCQNYSGTRHVSSSSSKLVGSHPLTQQFALRFTVLRCRLISPRSMWHCAAVRPITTPRCMATGAYDVEMTRCMVMQCVKYGYCAVCTQFPYFFKRTGCWTHFNARITAAENRTVSVGTTTQQRDTHSSTKFVWT